MRVIMIAAASSVVGLSACGPAPQSSSLPRVSLTPQDRRVLATLPPAYASADLGNGELHFSVCRSCHTIAAGGADLTGPNLHGVLGRRAGVEPGYDYSVALRGAGWTWDAARLDVWLTNPRAVFPDTKMTFFGIRDAADRRDLIAWLAMASARP